MKSESGAWTALQSVYITPPELLKKNEGLDEKTRVTSNSDSAIPQPEILSQWSQMEYFTR